LLSYFLGWPLIEALIFGSIVGGETSGAVVVPLAMSMGFKESPKSFIMLESALNSVLTAVLFISFVTIYQIGTGININNAVNSLVSTFSTGIVVGLVVSLFWIFILHNLNRHRHIYVLTLGLLLITYSISEALGGSGIFSVLIFGVVLGNFKLFTIIFKKKVRILGVKERLFEFQGEMTFLLTTFFFVFLGLLFNISYSNLMYTLIFGGLTLLILLGARALAVNVSTYKSQLSKDKTSIFLMCAQGVTPLVLMSLAIVDGVQLASQFIPLVTFVIISTNLITIVGAVLRKRGIVRGSGVSSRLF
jgi:cell volume regulation protein A